MTYITDMKSALAVAGILFCTSCATMVNGRYQQVKVDSYPGHAAIVVACGEAAANGGFTPATLKLPRSAPTCQVTVSKEGYREHVVVFERQESRANRVTAVVGVPLGVVGAFFGLVVGDFIGLDEDLVGPGWGLGRALGEAPVRRADQHTGGAYKWVPGDVFITLIRPEPVP